MIPIYLAGFGHLLVYKVYVELTGWCVYALHQFGDRLNLLREMTLEVNLLFCPLIQGTYKSYYGKVLSLQCAFFWVSVY